MYLEQAKCPTKRYRHRLRRCLFLDQTDERKRFSEIFFALRWTELVTVAQYWILEIKMFLGVLLFAHPVIDQFTSVLPFSDVEYSVWGSCSLLNGGRDLERFTGIGRRLRSIPVCDCLSKSCEKYRMLFRCIERAKEARPTEVRSRS